MAHSLRARQAWRQLGLWSNPCSERRHHCMNTSPVRGDHQRQKNLQQELVVGTLRSDGLPALFHVPAIQYELYASSRAEQRVLCVRLAARTQLKLQHTKLPLVVFF